MSPEAVPMEGTGGTGETLCSFAMPLDAISARCGGASTSELGVGKVVKGRIGMGLGGRSF